MFNRALRNNKGSLLMEYTPNSTFGERACSVAAPKLWNKLPFAIRNMNNINRFKMNYKRFKYISVLLRVLIILWKTNRDIN